MEALATELAIVPTVDTVAIAVFKDARTVAATGVAMAAALVQGATAWVL
jgi:ABC-type xylose transport system substrate-binding protein